MSIALHIGSTRAVIEALEAAAADPFNGSTSAMVGFVRTVDATGDDPDILDLSYIHATAVTEETTIVHINRFDLRQLSWVRI